MKTWYPAAFKRYYPSKLILARFTGDCGPTLLPKVGLEARLGDLADEVIKSRVAPKRRQKIRDVGSRSKEQAKRVIGGKALEDELVLGSKVLESVG